MLDFRNQIAYKFGATGASTPITPNHNESDFIMAIRKVKQLPKNIKIPKGARAIPLTKGYYALVDEEDFEKANQHNWHIHINGKHKYAITNVRLGVNKRTVVNLHRLILDFPSKPIDHINHNGLDNRRSNLRVCTPSQNCMNREPRGQLQTKGIKYSNNTWSARIQRGGIRHHLGNFSTQEEAQAAYNMAAQVLFGEYSRIVPIKDEESQRNNVIAYREQVHATIECLACGILLIKYSLRHKFCSSKCKEKLRHLRRTGKL